MIRRPPRSTPKPSSAASDVYKRQPLYRLCRINTKSRGQDTRTLTVRTGAFRGPGKTHTNRTPPYMPSDETPIKITVARPELARCAREPFGVLGKLTQFVQSKISHLPETHKNHGQDTESSRVHTGSFRGPGKTHTIGTLHFFGCARFPQISRSGFSVTKFSLRSTSRGSESS